MIAIVISEKGGTERREAYDQDEITVGRVKGNDVLLPKGNVSKRHARLIMRDGRYIVTDLKSTNGTYVNHRRITHATLVREGDRIYIGDFILRIDTGPKEPNARDAHAAAAPGSAARSSEEPVTGGEPSTGQSRAISRSATIPPATGVPTPGTPRGLRPPSHPPSSPAGEPVGASWVGGGNIHAEEVVSHFPIENDPDDSSPLIDVPAPPRLPAGLSGEASAAPAAGASEPSHEPTAAQPFPAPASSTGQYPARVGRALDENALPSDQTPPRSSHPALAEAKRTAQREALFELCEEVESDVGAEPLDELPRPNQETVGRVNDALERHIGGLSQIADVDLPALRETARRELLDLGPLDALLQEDHVTRIRAWQRELSVLRRGEPASYEGVPFSGASALSRAIRRICADAGAPVKDGEIAVERSLSGGRKLRALLQPAAADGPLLLIQRARPDTPTLNGLVRSGAISRSMALLLDHAVVVRANLLIAAPADQGGFELTSALCAAAPRGGQVLAIGEDDFGGKAARIELKGTREARADAVLAATRLAPDHLFCEPLFGLPLCALLDAVAEGQGGVVLTRTAPTLRQAIDRIAADVCGARDLGAGTAHEWIASAFDLGIEVARLKDGRLRVMRVAELRGSSHAPRDIFTFSFHRTAAGGAVEGQFVASGAVPRFVDEAAARGMPLDTALFRRHSSS